MAGRKKSNNPNGKRVTRYTYDDVKEPRTPETGHTPLLPAEELTVTLPMDNGWSKKIQLGRVSEEDPRPVVVDMDPDQDPVLLWAGKRSRREIPVLPLQRNEIVSESRIAQIIERARKAAAERNGSNRQTHLFADLERTLRESEKSQRVEFYSHDEGWRNKLICGDSLHVMESLLRYESLRGKVQMIYMDPPYGIAYDSNFQQRIDSPRNEEKDAADDVLTIKAFRDTWSLGVHSYLSYLQERLYLCRELLVDSGSLFLQINDENLGAVLPAILEVFGTSSLVSFITFKKTADQDATYLAGISDYLIWVARDRPSLKYRQLYVEKEDIESFDLYQYVELRDGTRRRLTKEELDGSQPEPAGGRRYRLISLISQGAGADEKRRYRFEGKDYEIPANTHWKVRNPEGLDGLAAKRRIVVSGTSLAWIGYVDDFPVSPITNLWRDTMTGSFTEPKRYAVQTGMKVVLRCIAMATDPGDIVLDPTCGSGTTAICAERLGRRWVTCDTSRVAVNVARERLLASTFEHYKTRNGAVSSGFKCRTVARRTLKSLAYNLEPEIVELVDQPEADRLAIRVCGPFEVMSIGRYSIDDWKGFVREGGKLENYIEVICRLYRRDAAIQGASGLVHAIAESEKDRIAVSVGPVAGRVTGKQINDAVQDALASGLLEVHVLGWAFEANVGEIKSQLEGRGRVKIELVMIRPDTLAEGLKVTKPEMLFSPLALPDLKIDVKKKSKDASEVEVSLKGVAVFDRKTRATDYKAADSGYVAAWYLDEDYDGDCFVDCQMFFDFKKAPNLKAALRADVDPEEFKLQTTSQRFPIRGHRRIAVKVVDVFGNESTVVKQLA